MLRFQLLPLNPALRMCSLLLKCSDLALRGQQQLCLLDRQLHVLDRGVLLALSLSLSARLLTGCMELHASD